MNNDESNRTELVNLKKFYLIAAVICTVSAAPLIGGVINGSFANFLTIAVLVISVMILLRRPIGDLTKMPCILAIISSALSVTGYIMGRIEQYTLLGFISEYKFPIDFTAELKLTETQLDALGLVMTLGAISLISWIFITVAAVLFFINHSRVKKMIVS